MAEYTANALQTVAVGSSVVFTDTVVDGCDLIYHRDDSAIVKLFPKSSSCYTRFIVAFSGNIAVPASQTVGAIQLALTIDGEPVPTTTMIVTPAAVGEFFNVAGFTYIYVRKPCCSTVGIRNTSTIPVNVQNANIVVRPA